MEVEMGPNQVPDNGPATEKLCRSSDNQQIWPTINQPNGN